MSGPVLKTGDSLRMALDCLMQDGADAAVVVLFKGTDLYTAVIGLPEGPAQRLQEVVARAVAGYAGKGVEKAEGGPLPKREQT